jgi:hypothetical protein
MISYDIAKQCYFRLHSSCLLRPAEHLHSNSILQIFEVIKHLKLANVNILQKYCRNIIIVDLFVEVGPAEKL